MAISKWIFITGIHALLLRCLCKSGSAPNGCSNC